MVTHHQMSPTTDSPMKAIPVIALSAMGSAILPKLVTRLRARAMSPSTLSVIMAATKMTKAMQRHRIDSPSWASSAQPKTAP